jgi:hypothetical protein
MRLFAGIPIVDEARREIVALLAHLRERDWPVRWVREEGLHLTLKFFGEVAPERLEVIEEAVRFAAQGTGALALGLDQLGAFPSAARPRVLWLGIAGPSALELLQDRLERGGALGGEADGLLDYLQPFRRDLAEELEREVEPLLPHPAHRPVALAQAGEQRDDLPPRLVDDRDAGEQPHQSADGAVSASSPPRR